MKSHRAVVAAVVAVGAMISTQCSSSQTSVPTAPGTGSAAATTRAIGPTADATPQPGKFKVCKSANSNVSGSFTVDGVEVLNNVTVYKTPFVLAPGECYIVAEARFRVPGASITVTETSAGFVGGTAVGTIMLGAVSADPGDLAAAPFASATQAKYFNEEIGRTLTFDNVVQVTGDQGCTPGYWGRPQHYDSWAGTGYSTGDDFDATFGVNFFSPNLTLLQANNQGGGHLKALGRHAVAALLNAASTGVAYAYTTAQVLDIVQGDGAYAGLNVNQRKDLLETANERGCPLS